jgi:cytochrome c oxidase assembly protein subunit 15
MAALGDTLLPAASLGSAFAQDFSSKSHYLLRVRILHPATAVMATVLVAWFLARIWKSSNRSLQNLAVAVSLIFLLQLALGMLNVALLAPMWLQIVHLFTADVLWTALVLLATKWLSTQALVKTGANGLGQSPTRRRGATPQHTRRY